jgi:hypothetical protein
MDEGLASQMDIRGTGTLDVVTSGGSFRVPTGVLEELRIGTLRISPIVVSWMPLTALRREDRRIAGVIGQDVLRHRTITIDYHRGQVELGGDPCRPGDVAARLTWADGRPAIPASIRGPGLSMGGALVLDSAANALLLFADRQPGARATSVSTHRGTTSADIIPDVLVDVAGLRQSGRAAVLPGTPQRDEIGLLPTAWFSRVCLDGPRSQATLSAITSRVRP